MSLQCWLLVITIGAFRTAAFVSLDTVSLPARGHDDPRSFLLQLRHQAGQGSSSSYDNPFPNSSYSPSNTTSLLLKVSFDGQRLKRSKRSLTSILRDNLAKLYGNVRTERITVLQTTCRTDNGIHAVGLVVQIYCCLDEAAISVRDHQLPLPKRPDEMCVALNRMCYGILQVKAYAYPPKGFIMADFASLSYLYRISIGKRRDPIQKNRVWHLDSVAPALMIESLHVACQRLKETNAGIEDMWCEQTHDPWTKDTLACDVHLVVKDHNLDVLEIVGSAVDQPCGPAHGLVLTSIEYNVPLDWRPAHS